MKRYNHQAIEKKWQKEWEDKKMYRASETSDAEKFYPLVEFPFPSGAGLHTGHIRSYTALDILARKRRMQGQNVLYPIGWDAFGLPTENYAIKTGTPPQEITKQSTDTFRKQLKNLGISFDWSREVNTTDPAYYKWTQWLFLQFYKHGLAYKAKIAINWCPKDKIGLANEEVVNGCCERCGTPVEKREKEQWMLAITKYADRLDEDLDLVDYQEKIKIQQRNWIGKSEGSEIVFTLSTGDEVPVFTTRADTIFGATYLVLAPEHALVKKLQPHLLNQQAVDEYITQVTAIAEIDRTAEGKEKTGIQLEGITAINPANGESIPVWIADYVLVHYGTGAVMAVPAHDERDFLFAQKFNLPIKTVIVPHIIDKKNPPVPGKPSQTRNTIHAVVFNPRTNKYLGLEWKKHPWTTFIVGGMEENEEPVTAARRELLEETGFKNVRHILTTTEPVYAEYYAAHKNENRLAVTYGVFFELLDEERQNITSEEKEKHQIVWLDRKDITEEKMTCAELPVWLSVIDKTETAFIDEGILYNSKEFTGLTSREAKKKITTAVGGKIVTKYKLRDWVFSRQRYWGEPIPMVHCEQCGWVPLPETDLPLVLPKVKKYEPTDTGESPLAPMKEWIETTCPTCNGPARRETDTMPNWAGSSWYFIRYVDPHNTEQFADPKKIADWLPVGWYNGGMEHTTLHLLYSRFWYKFLYDIKLVPTSEPYKKRTSHGLILAAGGEKMSKSKGNVVNPDDIVKTHGADTLRLYEMFMGPFDQAVGWSTDAIIGPRRFIERIWKLTERVLEEKATATDFKALSLLHKTIAKVEIDIESMHYNTAVSQLMICANELEKAAAVSLKDFKLYIQLLAPFAPHATEELWEMLDEKESIHLSVWPSANTQLLTEETVLIMVQVNGKVRGQFEAAYDITQEMAQETALANPQVKKYLSGTRVKRMIYVPGKLVNIVLE